MSFKVNVDGAKLGIAVGMIKSLLREGHIYTNDPTFLYMRGMDTAGVGLAECKLKCTYEGAPFDVAMEFAQLPTDMSGPVVLDVVNGSQMVVSTGRITYKLDLLHPTYVKSIPEPKVPFQLVFDLPVTELHMGLKAVVGKLDTKDTSASVRFGWQDNQFIIEDGKQSKVDVTYDKAELNIRQDCVTNMFAVYPADYIRSIVSSLGRFNRAIVAFGQHMPLSLGVNVEDVGAGWFIAPIVEQVK